MSIIHSHDWDDPCTDECARRQADQDDRADAFVNGIKDLLDSDYSDTVKAGMIRTLTEQYKKNERVQ